MGSENVVELTDANFEEEISKSDMPALVDFGAEWCMPCKMIEPIIDELAEEYQGRLKIGQVNTDANRDVSLKFGISAIPTLVLIKDGEVVRKFVGLQQKADMKAAIDNVLGT